MVGFAGGAEKADAAEPGGVGQPEGALQTAAHPGDPAEAAQVRQLRLQSSGKSPPGCALAKEGEKQGSLYLSENNTSPSQKLFCSLPPDKCLSVHLGHVFANAFFLFLYVLYLFTLKLSSLFLFFHIFPFCVPLYIFSPINDICYPPPVCFSLICTVSYRRTPCNKRQHVNCDKYGNYLVFSFVVE
jgi:hypothetical protein